MIHLGPTSWIDAASPINRASPHARGLVALWVADTNGPTGYNTSTIRDLAGRYHGTLGNDVAWSLNALGGAFDPGATAVTTGEVAAFNFTSTDFTLVAWVQAALDASRYVVLSNREAGTGWSFRIDGGNLQLPYPGVANHSSALAFENDVPQVLVASRRLSGDILFAINGATELFSTSNTPAASANDLHIGESALASNQWPGTIHAAGVWNRAMPEAEVVQLSDTTRRGRFNGLVNRLSFVDAAVAAGSDRPFHQAFPRAFRSVA